MAPVVLKVDAVRQILESRIRCGAYLSRDLPAERELADDLRVSRMTARKALQQLIALGTLERQTNGRLSLRRAECSQFALLVPSVASAEIERLRLALERVARERHCAIHTRLFIHWDDPVIPDTLAGCDGLFLVASCEPLTSRVIERFQASGRRIVSLTLNMSSFGIPSLDLQPPHFLQSILDHLAQQGHRRIDCFNTQTCDPIIEARLEQWRYWLAAHNMEGVLHSHPIRAYDSPLARGHEAMRQVLENHQLTGTALFCTTMPAALGAVRAMRDAGLNPGSGPGDIAVAAFSDENLGRYVSPSITSLRDTDPDTYLAICLDWMRNRQSPWVGPLLMRPGEPELFIGETTSMRRN